MDTAEITEMATDINTLLDQERSKHEVAYYNLSIDYWILRKAIDDSLSDCGDFARGRLARAIEQVDVARQGFHRGLATIQPKTLDELKEKLNVVLQDVGI